MKDNFSTGSGQYALYRPTYPAEFFEFLNRVVPQKGAAWDCGTGNGQIAYRLAATFEHVYATDISSSQLDNALQKDNIVYSIQPAERTNFGERFFDLVIVAQAIHWFNFEQFYTEVNRTAKAHALLFVVGYGRPEISEGLDNLISHFYRNVIGSYWDKERRYIDEEYETIPFPFHELESPRLVNKQHWTLEHLIGYLNTWSAVKHFINGNGYNPVDGLKTELKQAWGEAQVREVRFPLLLRVGKVRS